MRSLLELAVEALGVGLCQGTCDPLSLAKVPEAELAHSTFIAWQRCLAAAVAARRPLPFYAQQQQVCCGVENFLPMHDAEGLSSSSLH